MRITDAVIAGIMPRVPMNEPRVCSQCGYELPGRGLRGTCPECGQFWDAMTGVGLGTSVANRNNRTDRLIARLRTIALGCVTLLVLSCGGGLSWFAHSLGGNPWRPLALCGVVAGVFALAAVTSFFYEDQA